MIRQYYDTQYSGISDFNNDGYLDVIVTTLNGLIVYENISGEQFRGVRLPVSTQGFPVFSLVDIDLDGDIDIQFGSELVLNNLNFQFKTQENYFPKNYPRG